MSNSVTALDPRFTARERQPGLDLLRAIAIIIVILFHAGVMGFPLAGRAHRFGWIGVDLFFVLSGYLIGGQLLALLARGESFLGRFYARRALRILPAYLVVLAIYAFVPAWREYPEMTPLWKFIVSVQNIALRGGTAFSHAWSLAIEDQFYLALPFVLLLLIKRPRAAMLTVGAIWIGGIVLRAVLARQNVSPEGGLPFRAFQTWIYYPTWTRLDPLVCGVAVAAIEKFRPNWWRRLTASPAAVLIVGLAVVVFALWLGEGDELTVTLAVWQFPLIAWGMTLLLIYALSPRAAVSRVAVPGAAFMASIAYSSYLVQKLVIHAVAQWSLPPVTGTIVVNVAVFVAGAALFFAVERPFLQLRHRIAPRATPLSEGNRTADLRLPTSDL